ncbi:MAG: 3-isopropylmalate dehydratase small subunit [Armatimonadetes bacterium]|nr:3-isopropylmalate dehydratase small subunit [Armatimonadota bacterium]
MAGHVHKYGDHVDTDVIIPARYLNTSDNAELAAHCMEDLDAEFITRVRPGDVIVAGVNFGCGSSREHAPIAIKECGVSCVIAKSFARIFYRNALNIGLPIVECAPLVDETEAGDEVEVDLAAGRARNLTKGTEYSFPPLVGPAAELVAAGGLVALVKARLPAG